VPCGGTQAFTCCRRNPQRLGTSCATGKIEAYNQYLRGKESLQPRRPGRLSTCVKRSRPRLRWIQATQRLMPAWHWPILDADATNAIAGYETALAAADKAVALAPDWRRLCRSGFLACGLPVRYFRGAGGPGRAAALHPGDAEVPHRSPSCSHGRRPRAAIARERNALALIRFLRRSVCALHTS